MESKLAVTGGEQDSRNGWSSPWINVMGSDAGNRVQNRCRCRELLQPPASLMIGIHGESGSPEGRKEFSESVLKMVNTSIRSILRVAFALDDTSGPHRAEV